MAQGHMCRVQQRTGTRAFPHCGPTHKKCSISIDEINKMPLLTEEIIGKEFSQHVASLKAHLK